MSSQTQILGILMSIGDLVRCYSWEFQGNNFNQEVGKLLKEAESLPIICLSLEGVTDSVFSVSDILIISFFSFLSSRVPFWCTQKVQIARWCRSYFEKIDIKLLRMGCMLDFRLFTSWSQ